jgi:hypothetical protein
MKKILISILFLSFVNFEIKAQTKVYVSGGSEFIFSSAAVDINGISGGNIMRELKLISGTSH